MTGRSSPTPAVGAGISVGTRGRRPSLQTRYVALITHTFVIASCFLQTVLLGKFEQLTQFEFHVNKVFILTEEIDPILA